MKRLSRVALLAVPAAIYAAILPAAAMPGHYLPSERTQGSVEYLTGGIGSDEAKAMRKAESRYPLSLEFVQRARPRDEFLAAVPVTIMGAHGKVALETVSEGPYLFAQLPDGKYTVRAEHRGITQSRQVIVTDGKPQHLVFEWSGNKRAA